MFRMKRISHAEGCPCRDVHLGVQQTARILNQQPPHWDSRPGSTPVLRVVVGLCLRTWCPCANFRTSHDDSQAISLARWQILRESKRQLSSFTLILALEVLNDL